MLGVSFSELGLIMAVALVVLGPARLPGLVRKVGRWVGKARTMAREFQQQLESEINLEELNRITETRSKESSAKEPAADAQEPDLAGGGYPYGPQEPVPEPAQEADAPPAAGTDAAAHAPQPGDDTYSHAHAAGESAAVDQSAEPAEPVADDRKDSGPA